ncbi:MAG: type II toxin-antitoxin system RelE/ParE family toxin [Dehalococcoidia bacterium]|nr:type II toxin-antitoxin system RelE/ParE family toxin [Dehalococcoidia bacterium]
MINSNSYRISTSASRDLAHIWEYYRRVASEETADRQIARLHERFQILANHPYAGVARHLFSEGLRSHAVPNTRYIIFYFPYDNGVEIAHVVHGNQDTSRLFG